MGQARSLFVCLKAEVTAKKTYSHLKVTLDADEARTQAAFLLQPRDIGGLFQCNFNTCVIWHIASLDAETKSVMIRRLLLVLYYYYYYYWPFAE